ncbi:MAG: poly(3-hydroxyalkanoate) synthetase [Herbaspirillum sp.]|nr:poly(3-hydroxyalkanoate) synthetase [Herbaspirillum sp.]
MATSRKPSRAKAAAPSMEAATIATPTAVAPPPIISPNDANTYLTDAAQRTFIFLDTLLDRGNNYLEHLDQGTPPLLKFAHEIVLDGHDLPHPCNYALLCLTPPAEMPVNPQARPVVVVDPRAGHGPGIGGFKFDSEVGMAMRAGHTVYFLTFRPEPEENQTLETVMQAEARFMEEIIARHPQCKAKPVVIGNCQAGWAMMALNALHPKLFGPLMIVGAPVSYWAGSSTLNPMRYAGAALGGSWLASFTGDMGADRFDGVHLVKNFEKLNPANTWWDKYYKLWSGVDTEVERFLEFERWWGGYFRMTGNEIESIVENLFIGNRLARGTMMAGERTIDLRNITAPILVFASWGDNITPPPQALNWIIDTWGDERAIAAAGRTIIYVLHETVGHLGIFVGGSIALKEHDQLVTSLDVIESLPPGLYEMKLGAKAGMEEQRWDQLEPGNYTAHYQFRTMDDLRALNPEGRQEEAMFSTISKVSEFNANTYKTWVRPWVKLLAARQLGDAMGKLNPMRMQRQMFSDTFPLAPYIRQQADQARANRAPIPDDHPLRQLEKKMAVQITESLNQYRDKRDAKTVAATRKMFGPDGLGAWFKPDAPDADVAHARALDEIAGFRESALKHIADGGFAEAVCRIVLAGMVSIGAFERRSLRLARLLAQLPDVTPSGATNTDWVQLLKEQGRITAVAPVEALNALEQLLPDAHSRERALALSAAVMMIEPTLANPRSEIIEFLIGMLDVDPQRVIGLARKLTESLETPDAVKAPKLKPATAKRKLRAKSAR